ncbi:MAG: hypothetical protein WCT04_11790 [Planctomycetota bacterium]
MKVFCAAVLFIVSFTFARTTSASEGGERERAFVNALTMYDGAKSPREFRNAAAAFEALISPEYRNDPLFYNMGNARVKAGDYGYAILAYRKAKLFRPRDPWLEANLNQALSAAPGRVQAAPEPWWRSVFFWSGWLSYPEKFNLALGLWSACVAALALGAVLRKPRLNWAGLALGLVALLFSIDAYSAHRDLYSSNHAAVIAETIAQKSPGPNGDAAFDQPLKDGAEFTIIDRRGDWVFGHFHGIGDAWLPSKNIAE